MNKHRESNFMWSAELKEYETELQVRGNSLELLCLHLYATN